MSKRRISVRCLCGEWGVMYFTGKVNDGKEVVSFNCVCKEPQIDFDNPFYGYYA